MSVFELLQGDALLSLSGVRDGSVDCVVTSPPYYWMRDYGDEAQLGLEDTPQAYLDALLKVTSELLRVLAVDGTCWINLGDAYSQRKAVRRSSHQEGLHGERGVRPSWRESRAAGLARMSHENIVDGRAIPEKSLMMLPERLAIGMVDQGWLLRSRITWVKTFAVPDSAVDRPASVTEPVLLFARSPRYWFDRATLPERGDVWHMPPSAGRGDHRATYAPELPARAIAAGCKPGGLVLDPFSGAGTTGVAALLTGRRYLGIELNADYLDESRARLIEAETRRAERGRS